MVDFHGHWFPIDWEQRTQIEQWKILKWKEYHWFSIDWEQRTQIEQWKILKSKEDHWLPIDWEQGTQITHRERAPYYSLTGEAK